LHKKTRKTFIEAIRVAKKIADDRVEIFRLAGTYFWLLGKQKKAIKWWEKCIKSGEKMEAFPELARAYLEIGTRLKEPKSKFPQIMGLSAEECIEKAGKLKVID